MYCPQCGTQMGGRQRFCRECGADAQADQPSGQSSGPSGQPGGTPPRMQGQMARVWQRDATARPFVFAAALLLLLPLAIPLAIAALVASLVAGVALIAIAVKLAPIIAIGLVIYLLATRRHMRPSYR